MCLNVNLYQSNPLLKPSDALPLRKKAIARPHKPCFLLCPCCHIHVHMFLLHTCSHVSVTYMFTYISLGIFSKILKLAALI